MLCPHHQVINGTGLLARTGRAIISHRLPSSAQQVNDLTLLIDLSGQCLTTLPIRCLAKADKTAHILLLLFYIYYYPKLFWCDLLWSILYDIYDMIFVENKVHSDLLWTKGHKMEISPLYSISIYILYKNYLHLIHFFKIQAAKQHTNQIQNYKISYMYHLPFLK